MKKDYAIRYSNNWEGHPYKFLRVLNTHETNTVWNTWWHEDKWRHPDTIGQWRISAKKNKNR